MRIDLHLHSTSSDGVYAPDEVVKLALARRMDVIALTDHDNVDGVKPAQAAASKHGLQVLPGVELSTIDGPHKPHMLGYLFDVDNAAFTDLLATMRHARIGRAAQMVDKLAALGVHIPLDRVYTLAGEGNTVGRPHVAQVMLEHGVVRSLEDAFDRYIGNDGPAYVPNFELSPAGAIRAIHDAGGIAVLAHPGLYTDYAAIIERAVPAGLDGIEVYYYDHSRETTRRLERLATQHSLLKTVGSDFHRREPDGSARIGTVHYPAALDVVGSMRARANERHATGS